jgi:hypothetical protein
MKDANGKIEVVTAGGQKVTLQDTPAQIELAAASGTSVTISDTPSRVEVKTVAGVLLTISDTSQRHCGERAGDRLSPAATVQRHGDCQRVGDQPPPPRCW